MGLTMTTYDQAASLQFQDETISPATVADGTLRQRFDTVAFPQKGIKYSGTLGDALAAPVLTRGAILTTGGTFGPGLGVPVLTKGAQASALPAPVLTAGATNASGGTFGIGAEFWVLTAINALGETLGSNEITVTLTTSDSQVLNWSAVAGATGYKLYRGTVTGTQNVLVATLGAVTTYEDTGIAGTAATVPVANTTIVSTFGSGAKFWVITAVGAGGETSVSDEITSTLAALDTQTMTWVAIGGATGYKIYRGTATGVHGTLVATVGAVTTYTDTGATGTSASPPANLGTYYWKVVALNEEGAHAVSNEISAVCAASGGDVLPAGTVAMSWPAVVDAVSYALYRGTAPGAEGRLVYAGTGLSFVDTGAAGIAAAVPTGNTTGVTVPAPARTTHGAGS